MQIVFFTETVFLKFLNCICEVWGCPGAWHGPYEAIPSNFGSVWSYMAWGKSIFPFFGNLGNSLHHQIPPNWSSGLQVGPRFFLKARAPSRDAQSRWKLFLKGERTHICDISQTPPLPPCHITGVPEYSKMFKNGPR